MKLLQLLLLLCLSLHSAEAKKGRKRNYRPVTHPVVLWARTLSQSIDAEQKKIAAFKLSQYSQPIFQEEAVNTLLKCLKDETGDIRILCTKALGRAGTQGRAETIRKALLEHYKSVPELQNTIIRALMTRKDNHPNVQSTLLEGAPKASADEDLLVHLQYFEMFADGNNLDPIVEIFKSTSSDRVRRSAVKVVAERGHGQDAALSFLASCAVDKDTLLALNCLSGLQVQGRKDSKTWAAVEKTIQSSDEDVLLATLDVINVLPETQNSLISTRLSEIIKDHEDLEIVEKAVLALGVSGDRGESVANTLISIMEDGSRDISARTSAALVLGKQGVALAEKTRETLNKCIAGGGGQSLKTACQLGLKELETRAPKEREVAEKKS